MVDVIETRPSPSRMDDALDRTVQHGVYVLSDLTSVECVAQAHQVEHRLRALLDRGVRPETAATVTVACAHLAAGQMTDAYFALLAARGHTSTA